MCFEKRDLDLAPRHGVDPHELGHDDGHVHAHGHEVQLLPHGRERLVLHRDHQRERSRGVLPPERGVVIVIPAPATQIEGRRNRVYQMGSLLGLIYIVSKIGLRDIRWVNYSNHSTE